MKNSIAIDINADMGESFGRWVLGNDAALMPHVTSANIARIWGWHKRFTTYWGAIGAPSGLRLYLAACTPGSADHVGKNRFRGC